MPARPRRPAPTRLIWTPAEAQWLRTQQRRCQRGALGPFPSWAAFCKHAVIRATIPESLGSGMAAIPKDAVVTLSPAALEALARTLTQKE